MSGLKDDLRARFNSSVEELKTMRDEIKLKIHLGSMDAKKRWEQVEPQLGKIEQEIEAVGQGAYKAAGEMLDETRVAFKKLLDDLKSK
ncbi:MAG: hypothetical protein KC636_08210 [Myxococcales bacterium]|nr:hypothetical protein [Myxococcales bacterium]